MSTSCPMSGRPESTSRIRAMLAAPKESSADANSTRNNPSQTPTNYQQVSRNLYYWRATNVNAYQNEHTLESQCSAPSSCMAQNRALQTATPLNSPTNLCRPGALRSLTVVSTTAGLRTAQNSAPLPSTDMSQPPFYWCAPQEAP